MKSIVSTIKLELRAFLAILIVIVITVPTAYYFLSKPYNPPITVQNGFAEYNWTLEYLYNQRTYQWLEHINGSANATIQQKDYNESWIDSTLHEAIVEYTDSSIPGGGGFYLFLGEYINGSLSPDLHPKYVVPNLTMQLPASYLVSASVIGDSIHNITVPNASYSSHQLGGYGIIEFVNYSSNMSNNYHFAAWWLWHIYADNVSVNPNGTTLSFNFSLAVTGLQQTIYDNFTFNLRAEHLTV